MFKNARHNAAGISPGWSIAQFCSVAAAIAVTILLLASPTLGLYLTWDLLVPLVPATLLLAPRLWRNLCPIAVVHQLPRRLGLRGKTGFPISTGSATSASLLLFLAIVPLRLVLFNDNGSALAIFVVAILLTALTGGLLFSGKAGWCASICPVLPVERLYGQMPVLSPSHAHCETCNGCTKSCYDLLPQHSIIRLTNETPPRTDSRRASLRSMGTPMGVFAGTFPGFILGYFTVGHDTSLIMAYGWIIFWSIASYLLALGTTYLTGTIRPVLRASAVAAATLYYWFSVPAIAAQTRVVFHTGTIPGILVNGLRGIFGIIILVWIVRTIGQDRAERALIG